MKKKLIFICAVVLLLSSIPLKANAEGEKSKNRTDIEKIFYSKKMHNEVANTIAK